MRLIGVVGVERRPGGGNDVPVRARVDAVGELVGVFSEQVSEVGVVPKRAVGLELVPDGVAAQFPGALDVARLLILDRAGREEVPLKITSSMLPPVPVRIRLAEFSPMTQRRASTKFDLPQPFGPTIPVRPGPISSSVLSTKDLKPLRRNFSN